MFNYFIYSILYFNQSLTSLFIYYIFILLFNHRKSDLFTTKFVRHIALESSTQTIPVDKNIGIGNLILC